MFSGQKAREQQAKKLREKIGGARRGDTVVTAGGILGTVVKTPAADDAEVTIEIADNVQVKVVKFTLTDVRPKGGEVIADKG